LGTDLSVPDAFLRTILARYRADLHRESLEHVIFGHIGDNHVHVNIIPDTLDDYRRGRALYLEWARAVVGLGGSVSAEHGIGKLKTDLLREMYGEKGIAEMRELKSIFDPAGILNPGNLFACYTERLK
jgi:D-lactate dehydrogenase (cytochrome)